MCVWIYKWILFMYKMTEFVAAWCTVDVIDSFLLFVEMSPDVFAEDLPSCFWFCQIKKHGLGLSYSDAWSMGKYIRMNDLKNRIK